MTTDRTRVRTMFAALRRQKRALKSRVIHDDPRPLPTLRTHRLLADQRPVPALQLVRSHRRVAGDASVMRRIAGKRLTYRELCGIDGAGFMGIT